MVFITPSGKKLVTLIPGDGVGAECVAATRRIIEATGVPIEWEERRAGASVFREGNQTGVPDETVASIQKTRVALKGPLETPIGFGEKSANVTLRKLFETFGNIRPVRELPGVKTPYSGRGIDLVIVRENVEDLYAGIEHMQSPGVAQCLKLISRKGCEKIVRLGFEVARAEGRRKVHCATKANIMKLTEGLLKRTFEEVAKEYPDIEANHIIVDNAAHQLVRHPENFEVIITTNMNGDILSDLTSGLIGGLGFAPSANLGSNVAIFEAVHGSAPKYAGKNVINPTAVLSSGVMMLRYLGEFEAAQRIEHAVLVTLEQGIRTRDVSGEAGSVSTTAFTDAIIANLGKRSERWTVRDYKPIQIPQIPPNPVFFTPQSRRDVGADVFIETDKFPREVGPALEALTEGTPFRLKLISNRGTKVYPDVSGTDPDVTDVYRCRFKLRDMAAGTFTSADMHELLRRVETTFRWVHIERLLEVDGKLAYTKAAGEE